MSTYRISQLAGRAGVPATTLRFYEKQGLLPAARTSSGYRQYTDADGERVRFITAAKHLGLSLDQIRGLLAVREGGMCREVRDALQVLVAAQVVAADERLTDLRVFRDRLTAAAEHLEGLPAEDGPCGAACSFLHDPALGAPAGATAPRPGAAGAAGAVPVACSLDGGEYGDRIQEWARLLDGVEVERLADGGRVARLPVHRAVAAAGLAAAEQQCCPFLSLRLTFADSHVELVARAPAHAGATLAALFDAPAPGEGCPC